MRIEFEEEIKPTGDGARSERQDWRTLRKLDAEIAERVMGWTRHPDEAMHPSDNRTIEGALYCPPGSPTANLGGFNCVPYYSTDIAAAMEVVNTFIAKGGRVSLRGGISELMDEDVPPGYWQALFFRYLKECAPGTRFSFRVNAATLPEAICRAALEALVDNPQKGE